ncbi:MAG: tRNA (adenosine(37)-N6)-threonylcarbamoyltransferase complex dimerization subunit type 1 TsaB [Bacteroidetes bacterium]|nr:tRNA (adenosine(37)-N6)-threonylcarbamoyltransferase complex dimerization subunit type 1 TsaB [Bacteroidota bacterium]
MALILCLETATRVCSVSLSRDASLLSIRESESHNVHSSKLTVFIDEMMKEAGHSFQELDAVAVSMGPGSYTGLRIGVATAKGLCYALDKPMIAVPTLQAMATGINLKFQVPGSRFQVPGSRFQVPGSRFQVPGSKTEVLFVPMIDARRMEVFCGIYNEENVEIREVRAEIIDEHSFGELLENHLIIFGGDGSEKCKPVLGNHPNAFFLDSFAASAKYMIPRAVEKFVNRDFENLAYFEPFYLKDFVAGKPRVKGLL